MLNFFKNLFGFGAPTPNFKDLVANDALIIDVRSPQEFTGGNVAGSINIPLDRLAAHSPKLDKTRTVITCCASGMRSGMARTSLLNQGFAEVHNGGGWLSLNNKLGFE
jgi:rhodanese-related sulfurtransferase